MQLFVNDLTVIDFSYCCPRRGIVGESWVVDVLLDGRLNEMNMVLDFAVVKKQIKAIIDDEVDHKLLIPMLNEAIVLTQSTLRNDHEFLDFSSDRGSYYLQSPAQAFAKINTNIINEQALINHLTEVVLTKLPENVQGLTLNLRPEHIEGDYYHYTHGLKLHDGNCQRIAHGHRSKILIYQNNERAKLLEQQWCLRWQDIYLASANDAIDKDQLEISQTGKNNIADHQCFSYFAPQGRFDIAVPNAVLDIVDCDSTVELLADFIVRQLKQQQPNDEIKVVAFEGVAKGAIAHG